MSDADYLAFARMLWDGNGTIDSNLVRIIRSALTYFNPASTLNPDCNPIEQLARQERLEYWYEIDGRHDPEHEQHSLYTGLAERYMQGETTAA